MPKLGTYGSVRGALSNGRPYRDCELKSSRIAVMSCPVSLPFAVSPAHPKCQHVFSVFRAPPRPGQLHALLHEVAVGAFDFTRSDGQ